MNNPFTRAFLALAISLFLIAPVALAEETVTGPMVRHQNAAFVRTVVRHRNAAFIRAMVRHVAQTHHIPADRLKVGHATSTVLPLTGKTLYMGKILDTTTGKVYGVAADETGAIVDADSLRDAERRAFAARYGKLSPRLFERVAQAGSGETIPALVWLDDGGEVPDAPHMALGRGQDAVPPVQIEAARDRHRERMAEVMERRQAPVIADVVAKGGRVVFASRLAPMLAAELTPQAIRALEKRPDVWGLDLDVPITSLIEEGTEAIRAHEVWSDGLEGDPGTTVAVVESGTVYPSSAYLTVDAYYDTSPCGFAECAAQHDHATGVAAVIAKSDVSGAWRGVAPGVRLINGNAGSTDHYRIRIDTTNPPAPSISSATHPLEGTCCPSDAPSFTWSTPDDVSGIVGYSYDFDDSPATTPDTEVDTSGNDVSFAGVAAGDWYLHVRAKDGSGRWSATDHYYVCIGTPLVGPLVYGSLTIDDDASGESAGDGDGVVECGEAIELYVDLRNQGTDPARDVYAQLSESDPYVSFLYNTTSAYPDIPGGQSRSNGNDFDFTVAPGTPHGHVIHLDLDVTGSNGGPWSDGVEVAVGRRPGWRRRAIRMALFEE
jgi:hypothetical protein